MAFINGCIVIDAPASALNNSGESIAGARTDNTVAVKFIRAQDGKTYPYASGQAMRYWLRNALENNDDIEWNASPLYRGDKVAFSDANPIRYWDDDLLGYMRAPGKADHKNIMEKLEELGLTPQDEDEKGTVRAVTRASPFRVGTLVSIGPVTPTADFGTMNRQDGDPVPHEHQFYRATMHTLFSLDMRMVGRFSYLRRSGFQNLDSVRRIEAQEAGLTHLEDEKAYRLPDAERTRRIHSLLNGLGRLQGGAKQAIHYTDVSPAVIIFAIVKGGNHPFNYLFRLNGSGEVAFQQEVFAATVSDLVKRQQLLSPVCIGWKHGFLPESRALLTDLTVEGAEIFIDTPQAVLAEVGNHLVQNPQLLDS